MTWVTVLEERAVLLACGSVLLSLTGNGIVDDA